MAERKAYLEAPFAQKPETSAKSEKPKNNHSRGGKADRLCDCRN